MRMQYNYYIVNLLINNWQLTKHIRPVNICEFIRIQELTRSTFEISKWRQWRSAVEARLLNENNYSGHSIRSKTSQVDRRVQ